MAWTDDGNLSRFHPLIIEFEGTVAWWVCDGHADTESNHSLAMPYIEEPCVDRDECRALCDILEEEHESD